MKHVGKRDVPRAEEATHRQRGTDAQRGRSRAKLAARIVKDDGSTFPDRAVEREPRRPPFCMLLPVLDNEDLPVGVYGMYPASFIPKILPWLKCDRSEILHVCSGGLPPGEGIRVDIRPEAKPDVVADGRALPFEDNSHAAALIDPPYTPHYAKELFGVEYPRPAHLLKEAARVVRPNGRIALVHYIVANAPRGAVFITAFGLSMGFGYPLRAVTIYEKCQSSLFVGEDPPPNERSARRIRRKR